MASELIVSGYGRLAGLEGGVYARRRCVGSSSPEAGTPSLNTRIDAPHGVKQKNQKTPKRDELETALGELVVSGSRLMTTGTNCCRAFARAHGDVNALVIRAETGLLVNESWKTVTTI
jgi:hypothetical protein